MGDAKYCDAGQDQKRHRANNAAPQTIAREMTAHGLWPSDTFNRPTTAGFLGSTLRLRPLAPDAHHRWVRRVFSGLRLQRWRTLATFTGSYGSKSVFRNRDPGILLEPE
jgi:hypothetical protein